MTMTLRPKPLTRERFAPYGDVIEAAADHRTPMNAARFERFDHLCEVDLPHQGRAAVSIARCRVATSLPYRIDWVERHPHGSQAFVPLISGTHWKLMVRLGRGSLPSLMSWI